MIVTNVSDTATATASRSSIRSSSGQVTAVLVAVKARHYLKLQHGQFSRHNFVQDPISLNEQDVVSSSRRLQTDSQQAILVAYTLDVNAQDVLVSSADPEEAFSAVTLALEAAITSTEYDQQLQVAAKSFNSPVLLRTNPVSSAAKVAKSFETSVTHSAFPTSQPTTQPSSYPSSQPTSKPTTQPSSLPSSQPSTVPTSSPTSQPSFQIETKWMNNVGDAFERTIGNDKDGRSSYFDLRVEAQQLYGSCTEWNNYILRSLPASAAAKDLRKITLQTQGGYTNSSLLTVTCDDMDVILSIVQSLTSSLSSRSSSLRSKANRYNCDGRTWVVQECRANRFESRDGLGFNTSKALCVDCADPCSQYSCAEDPGLFVLSPCTAVASGKECAHLQGTMRIISTDVDDEPTVGFAYILQWYGAVWGIVILTVLAWDLFLRVIYDGCGLSTVLPPLTFRLQQTAQPKRVSSVRAISPVPTPGSSKITIFEKRDFDINPPGSAQSFKMSQISPVSTLHRSTQSGPRIAATTDPAEPGNSKQNRSVADEFYLFQHAADAIIYRVNRFVSSYGESHSRSISGWAQAMIAALQAHHLYAAPFARLTWIERYAYGLNLLNRLSWIFLYITICFYLNYPDDDGSCYDERSHSACKETTALFNDEEKYCKWVGLRNDVDVAADKTNSERDTSNAGANFIPGELTDLQAEQELYQAQCVWVLHSGSVRASLHMVLLGIVLVAAVRLIFTSYLIESVVLAPAGDDNAFHFYRIKSKLVPAPVLRFMSNLGAKLNRVGALGSSHDEYSTRAKIPKESGMHNVLIEQDISGGIISRIDKSTTMKMSTVLYRSFLDAFMKFRKSINKTGPPEAVATFHSSWREANKFILEYEDTLRTINAENEAKSCDVLLWNRLFPPHNDKVKTSLLQVFERSKFLANEYRDIYKHDPDQFGVRLLVEFMVDLIGANSIQAVLFRSRVARILGDDVPLRDVKFRSKLCTVIFILCVDVLIVYASVVMLQDQTRANLRYWLGTIAVFVAVDLFLLEPLEVLWFHYILPSCTVDAVVAMKETMFAILQHFYSEHQDQDPTMSARLGESFLSRRSIALWGEPDSEFCMQEHQFAATRVAQMFPKHVASQIVSSYRNPIPFTITSHRWPSTRTIAERLCFGLFDWSSGLGVESVGYVLISHSIMWVGAYCPVCLQQLLLSAMLSLVAWLVSLWVHYCIDNMTIGPLLAVGVVLFFIAVWGLYRLSWAKVSGHATSSAVALAATAATDTTAAVKGTDHAAAGNSREEDGLEQDDVQRNCFFSPLPAKWFNEKVSMPPMQPEHDFVNVANTSNSNINNGFYQPDLFSVSAPSQLQHDMRQHTPHLLGDLPVDEGIVDLDVRPPSGVSSDYERDLNPDRDIRAGVAVRQSTDAWPAARKSRGPAGSDSDSSSEHSQSEFAIKPYTHEEHESPELTWKNAAAATSASKKSDADSSDFKFDNPLLLSTFGTSNQSKSGIKPGPSLGTDNDWNDLFGPVVTNRSKDGSTELHDVPPAAEAATTAAPLEGIRARARELSIHRASSRWKVASKQQQHDSPPPSAGKSQPDRATFEGDTQQGAQQRLPPIFADQQMTSRERALEGQRRIHAAASLRLGSRRAARGDVVDSGTSDSSGGSDGSLRSHSTHHSSHSAGSSKDRSHSSSSGSSSSTRSSDADRSTSSHSHRKSSSSRSDSRSDSSSDSSTSGGRGIGDDHNSGSEHGHSSSSGLNG